MQIPYTYFPAKEGGFIGYWNDYPDYLTEGETVHELEYMLRDLRKVINVMISKGEIPSAPRYEMMRPRSNPRLLSSFREADAIESGSLPAVSYKSGKDVIFDCLSDVSSS